MNEILWYSPDDSFTGNVPDSNKHQGSLFPTARRPGASKTTSPASGF